MAHHGRKIVVIGGGMAGLCAAVYLLKCGYQAEVLEMHDMAGGLATSWRRGSYTSGARLHWLFGSNPNGWMHGQWQEVFETEKRRPPFAPILKDPPEVFTLYLWSDPMTQSQAISAAASGTFLIGGDLPVNRLGYGAMRIIGPGMWGPPADKPAALAVLRRAVELGVNLIDTADSYGPGVSEELIAEALYPYPAGLVIATKGGWERPGPGQWTHNASPKHLAAALEGSLKRLHLDRIDVHQLHVPDPAVSFEASVETLANLREQGKIRHVGLSNVTREHIERARAIVPVVSVQNRYSFADREYDYVVDHCEKNGIAFMPWAPLGQARKAHEALQKAASQIDAIPFQVALAWLLKRSKVILPIPGTASIPHLEENIAAAGLELPQATYDELSALSHPPASLRG
jgi:aryl-alcohol dehydrogenase-like predicted oxidoreductase